MKFDWRNFTEEDYNKYLEKCEAKIFDAEDYLGAVCVGDICIELLDSDWFGEDDEYEELEKILMYNIYVAHVDSGYAYKNGTLPYDHAGEGFTEAPYGLSYEEFKNKVEKLFEEFITKYDECQAWNFKTKSYVKYSLVEHANRPLEVW